MTTIVSLQAFRFDLRLAVLLSLTLLGLVWTAMTAPIPQPASYHQFADQRTLVGIPHFWNVITNMPFAVIGVAGVIWLCRRNREVPPLFEAPGEFRGYLLFFVAEALTALGSSWYHASPNNATLVWDRLPFSLMLTSFFAIVITEFVSNRGGQRLVVPWSALGVVSVLFWAWSESAGRGDLRLYFFVQFYPVVAIPLVLLLFRSRYSHSWTIAMLALFFVIAKIAEVYDVAIYEAVGISGHTIKHVVAAGASWFPLYGLRRRSVRSGTE